MANNSIENSWQLEPFVKVGIFNFGDTIPKYSDSLKLCGEALEMEDELSFYIVGSQSLLTIDEKFKIKHISCRDECNLKGVNLIGKPLEEVEALLEHKAVPFYPEINNDVFDIDELGLLLTVDDDRLVKIVDCSKYYSPDEI